MLDYFTQLPGTSSVWSIWRYRESTICVTTITWGRPYSVDIKSSEAQPRRAWLKAFSK